MSTVPAGKVGFSDHGFGQMSKRSFQYIASRFSILTQFGKMHCIPITNRA
jgi:hypothetical protein